MKVSLLKISRKKEVIKRLKLSDLAEMIRNYPEKKKVFNLRLNYQFLKPQRQPSGLIVVDNQQHTVSLPRILFAVECMNYKDMEMIAETFRKPKEGEGRWWKTSEILNLFASKYAYFDAFNCSPNKLGRAMNSYKFSFKHRNVNGLSEYWLAEK